MAVEFDEDFEEYDPAKGIPFGVHVIAGSSAGLMEHCAMFPVDTVKTHLQAMRDPRVAPSAWNAAKYLVQQEGAARLWRGVTPVLVACIPAHAAYFSVYEKAKRTFGAYEPGHHPIAAFAAGGLATITHDLVMTPLDVCKQRLQLGRHRGLWDCITSVVQKQGVRALYISYPTTLMMNIPYAGIMVSINDSMKLLLNPTGEQNLPAFLISGACGGAVASGLTTPLDVIKTRQQTQTIVQAAPSPAVVKLGGGPPMSEPRDVVVPHGRPGHHCHDSPYSDTAAGRAARREAKKKYSYKSVSFHRTAYGIYKNEGFWGFWKGVRPRMLYSTPSVAICWSTYETLKRFFADS